MRWTPIRYLPILSASSVADVDFLGRCGIAAGTDSLVLPCFAEKIDKTQLPSKMQALSGVVFSDGWSFGLKGVMDSLKATGIEPALSNEKGKAIALRSYVPEPVIKSTPETVYANTFATTVPDAVQVCELTRELSIDEKTELRRYWAYVEANAKTLLAFESPPNSVPLKKSKRLAAYAWQHYKFRYNKKSTDVVKELVRRSLEVACVNAGLKWCDDRKKYYFAHDSKTHYFLSYTHVDGRSTRVAVTGEKLYGSGERAAPFRYQLCPTFRVGHDEAGDWWVTMRIYIRITDVAGKPYEKKAITRRRKKVANAWWNKEWFARTVAVMQAIANEGSEITVGSGNEKVTVSPEPLRWDCPVAIDYIAVERIGDFQEEMAELRYVENDDEDGEEPDGVSNDE